MNAPLPLHKIGDLIEDFENQLEIVNTEIICPGIETKELFRLANARYHLKITIADLKLDFVERMYKVVA